MYLPTLIISSLACLASALPPSQPAVAAPPALEKRQDTSDTSPQDCTLTTLAGFNEGYTEVHSLTETQVFLPPWRCACAGDAEVEVYETQSYGTCGTVLWWPKIADGFAAFFKSSLCADGGTTLFCGTSTEGSVAQTTIIPEPSPGSANSPVSAHQPEPCHCFDRELSVLAGLV